MSNRHTCNPYGFTLLEVIIIFVIGAVLAAMTMPYFYSGAMKTETPIDRLQASSHLNQAMETIVADHDNNFTPATSTTLANFANKVNAFSTNYSSSCTTCTATAVTTTIGSLTTALLVTITSSTGEKIYHVFTIQE